jgi:hypothetical protein
MNSLSKFAIGFLLVVPLNWLLPNQAAAAATLQDFDNPGTPYTLTNYSGDLWTIESGGPYGNFLRLCTPTPETHNTIGFDLTEPGFGSTAPAPGTYLRITADFDFRIDGISDGMGLVLLDTGTYGATGPAPDRLELEEPGFPNSFGVGLDVIEGQKNEIVLYFNNALVATFPMDTSILKLNDGVFHHARVTVDFVSGGARVNVNFDNSYTLIWAGFIPGMTAYENRVAFGARAGAFGANHDVDNINVQYTTFTPTVSTIGSITGRIVDASTSVPLSGTAEPFAHAYLYRCDLVGCGYVNDQLAGSDGRFTFTSDAAGLSLEPGTYKIGASADGYDAGQTNPFAVGEGQDWSVGDVPLQIPIIATVDPTGTVVSKTGAATIHGTVTCASLTDVYSIYAELVEKTGRHVASGYAFTAVPSCLGQMPWSVTVSSSSGWIFGAGSAAVPSGYACGCNVVECPCGAFSGPVQLKGSSGK